MSGHRICRLFSNSVHRHLLNSRSFSSGAAAIKPVSYASKPQEDNTEPSTPHPPPPPPSESPSSLPGDISSPLPPTPTPRRWTRDDLRFMKDAPVIAPVSYSPRVAPLPEDRAPMSEEDKKKEAEAERLRREVAAKAEMEAKAKVGTREMAAVPYPTLVKVEKRPAMASMDLMDAIREVKANATKNKRKLVETVEAHVNLGVDPRRGDQMVRGALTLPHGTGKTVRVAVFAEGPSADEARAAGADVVGGDELIEEIKSGGGKLNFDKCIATPIFMPRLSKIARILGPRGLMPNPKLGSVTSDVSGAVKAAKSGRIDFKIDKTAIVHVGIGKVDFPVEKLRENIGAFVHALLLAKPVGLKKTSKYVGYVKNFSICSTMGPGFPVTIQSLSLAADHYNKVLVK